MQNDIINNSPLFWSTADYVDDGDILSTHTTKKNRTAAAATSTTKKNTATTTINGTAAAAQIIIPRRRMIRPGCRAGLERLYSSNRVETNFALALTVESSSKPSGLTSLYAQPYVYGGTTWNANECPYRLCLAGTSSLMSAGDDIVFAAACVPNECHADDLVATTDWIQALQDVPIQHNENILRTGTSTTLDVNSDSRELWQEYTVLHHRIAEINKFLTKGWTCGNWNPGSRGITISPTLDEDLLVAASRGPKSNKKSLSPSSNHHSSRSHRSWMSLNNNLPSMSTILAGSLALLLSSWALLVLVATYKMSIKRRRNMKKDDGDYEDDSNLDDDEEEEGVELLSSDAETDKQTMASWSGGDDDEEEMVVLHHRSVGVDIDDDDDCGGNNNTTTNKMFIQFREISPTSVMASLLSPTSFGQEGEFPQKMQAFWSSLDLQSHWRSLFVSTSSSSSSDNRPTAVLEGLRVLSLLWIVAGHCLATVSSTPGVINPADLLPPNGIISTLFGQIFFASRLAVDTFFCISGFLLVHVMEKKIRKSKQKFGWSQIPQVVVSRMIRLLPVYGVCLGYYILLAPRFHSFDNNQHHHFPFWYQWQHLLRPCREWYWNVLFVNNFLPWDRPTSGQCFYHSWYLAVDMQLFLLAQPILVVLFRRRHTKIASLDSSTTSEEQLQLSRNRTLARYVTLILITLFSIMTMYLAYMRRWSLNTLDGAAVARYDVEAYAKPHVRAPSYLAGMYLALLLPPERIQLLLPASLSSSSDCKGWPQQRQHSATAIIISLVIMLCVVFCTATGAYARRACQYHEWPQISNCGSAWSPNVTWLYTATSRAFWIGALVVLLYNSVGTTQHIVAHFLSWNMWTPLSRLTFAAYLIHPIVLFVLQLGKTQKQVFSLPSLAMQYIAVTVVSFLASLVAALFFEFPAAALWKEYVMKPRLVIGYKGVCAKENDKDTLLQKDLPGIAARIPKPTTAHGNYGSIEG